LDQELIRQARTNAVPFGVHRAAVSSLLLPTIKALTWTVSHKRFENQPLQVLEEPQQVSVELLMGRRAEDGAMSLLSLKDLADAVVVRAVVA
jgi:hypothetical protein